MKKEKNRNPLTVLPLDLQFFAESGDGASGDDTTNPTPDAGTEGTKDTTEKEEIDYSAKFVEAEARNKKLKADLDSALKKLGDLNKQYRAKMSEDELKAEQDAIAKEEHDRYVADLEAYKSKNEALKRYILQGMDQNLAEKAAQAEIDGDMDELAAVQQTFTKSLIKAKEAEWKASRPRVNVGDGEESTMTKEEILAIEDRDQRQVEIAKHLNLFTK